MDINNALSQLMSMAVTYLPKFVLTIVTLIVGWFVINLITKYLKKAMSTRKVDKALVGFLHSVISALLKVMLILSVLGMVGIEVTSFIAFLGAAGLAIGLALQGGLQNFAGGVMILLFKPFKVGDLISTQGYTGVVSEIQIFQTILKTVENNTVIVPNSPLVSGSLINYSTEPHRRVDVAVPVGNGADIEKIKKIFYDEMKKESKILLSPEPFIVIVEYGIGTVKLLITAWCTPENYWPVFFFMNEMVKREFEKNNISFPTPAQFIHLKQN